MAITIPSLLTEEEEREEHVPPRGKKGGFHKYIRLKEHHKRVQILDRRKYLLLFVCNP